VPLGQGPITCSDLAETNFKSVGTDPDNLDPDGNGIACETN